MRWLFIKSTIALILGLFLAFPKPNLIQAQTSTDKAFTDLVNEICNSPTSYGNPSLYTDEAKAKCRQSSETSQCANRYSTVNSWESCILDIKARLLLQLNGSTDIKTTTDLTLPNGQKVLINIPNALIASLPKNRKIEAVYNPNPSYLSSLPQSAKLSAPFTPLAQPVEIGLRIIDSDTKAPATLPETLLIQRVEVQLPILKSSDKNSEFRWFISVQDGDRTIGYRPFIADYDPQSSTVRAEVRLYELLSSPLFVPVMVTPTWVQNFDPNGHIFSGPSYSYSNDVDFDTAAPQFTTFTVLGPQLGDRIPVYNPATASIGWIDAKSVGPTGPPNPFHLSEPDQTVTAAIFGCRIPSVQRTAENEIKVNVVASDNQNLGYNRARWYLSKENTNQLYDPTNPTKNEYLNTSKSSNYQFDGYLEKESGGSNSVTKMSDLDPNSTYFIQAVAYVNGGKVNGVEKEAVPCTYSGPINLTELKVGEEKAVLAAESSPFTTGLNVTSSTGDILQVCADYQALDETVLRSSCQTVGSGSTVNFTVDDPAQTARIQATVTPLTTPGVTSNSLNVTIPLPDLRGFLAASRLTAISSFDEINSSPPPIQAFNQEVTLTTSFNLDSQNPVFYAGDSGELIAYSTKPIEGAKFLGVNQSFDPTGSDLDCQANTAAKHPNRCVYRLSLVNLPKGDYNFSFADKQLKLLIKDRQAVSLDPCPNETLAKVIVFRADDTQNLFPGVIFENCQWQSTQEFSLTEGDNSFKLFKQFKDGSTQTNFLVVKKRPKLNQVNESGGNNQ